MSRDMKDSGIEWIGQIPNSWLTPKIKRLFNISRGRVIPKTDLSDSFSYPVYSSQTLNNGILGYLETFDFDIPQITWTTDGANAGTVFLREGKYSCTNICGILTPTSNENDLRFIKYALQYTAQHHKRKDTNGYKIMSNEMAEIEIALPNRNVQEEIANFLDEKTSEIENIVEKTKQSIEELKAYKQSLITETVTKGLNPDVPMKDSGIEWIGNIPSNWKTGKLKNFTTINDDSLSNRTPSDYEFKYVDIGSVSLENGIEKYEVTNFKEAPSRARRVVKNKDIIISTVRTYLKAIAVIDECENTIVSTGFAVIRPRAINSTYLSYFLKSDIFTERVNQLSEGIAYPSISSEKLINIKIVLPDYNSQIEIGNLLDERTKQIDHLVIKKQQMIEELVSYKQSLIYEYVTGKKEVK